MFSEHPIGNGASAIETSATQGGTVGETAEGMRVVSSESFYERSAGVHGILMDRIVNISMSMES